MTHQIDSTPNPRFINTVYASSFADFKELVVLTDVKTPPRVFFKLNHSGLMVGSYGTLEEAVKAYNSI